MANTFFPKEINCQVTVERHFHGFSSFDGEQLVKICQHHWKVTKFESYFLKTNKDIDPQSRGIFKRFIRRAQTSPPPYKCLFYFSTLWSCFFVLFEHITFKLG